MHYSLNASQCQLYYCKAIPDWRPRVGGEKLLQNTAWCPGRKQGRGCDGWVCLTQAEWKAEMGLFPMRQGDGRAPALLPGAPKPCQDERHLAKLLLSVLLSLVSKQMLSIFNRYNWTSRDGNTEAQQDKPQTLWQAWCQHEGRSPPPSV